MAKSYILPTELETLRKEARRSIYPIEPASQSDGTALNFWLSAKRTKAGRWLPPYYLVYFLLVELLRFRDLGRDEKVAWVVPIDFKGDTFTIEHRKFGVGVFAPDPDNKEQAARRIVSLIKRGVTFAEPFFEWLASDAVHESKLNVTNQSTSLFERYRYFTDRYGSAQEEIRTRRDERIITRETDSDGTETTTVEMPVYALKLNAKWVGMAAIDAFFAWTEHVFVHVAILLGQATTGKEVTELAEADWQTKFKAALDLKELGMKGHFDKLVVIRRQLRNYMAHGAFGKQGEAFKFHSRAGAVPVLLTRRPNRGRFSLSGETIFDEEQALKAIEHFIVQFWSGSRAPARIYLEEYDLPTILTMASDGSYVSAMQSVDHMEEFAEHLSRSFDIAADMDW